MGNDKSKKTAHEVSLTRRALIKAGWAIPVILSIGLPVGDVFVHATTGWEKKGKDKQKKLKTKRR